MEVMRIGIRVKKNSSNHAMIARHSEIYDIDTGRILPALGATITMDVNNFMSVVTDLELSDMEVIDED